MKKSYTANRSSALNLRPALGGEKRGRYDRY